MALPVPASVSLKPASDFNLIGKPARRARQVHRAAGIRHGHAPVWNEDGSDHPPAAFRRHCCRFRCRAGAGGQRYRSRDASRSGPHCHLCCRGGRRVLAGGHGTGKLQVQWQVPAELPDSRKLDALFAVLLDSDGIPARPGDLSGKAGAKETITEDLRFPFFAHAPMEPLNAVIEGFRNRRRPAMRHLDRHPVPDHRPSDGRGYPGVGGPAGAHSHHVRRRRVRAPRHPDSRLPGRRGTGDKGMARRRSNRTAQGDPDEGRRHQGRLLPSPDSAPGGDRPRGRRRGSRRGSTRLSALPSSRGPRSRPFRSRTTRMQPQWKAPPTRPTTCRLRCPYITPPYRYPSCGGVLSGILTPLS